MIEIKIPNVNKIDKTHLQCIYVCDILIIFKALLCPIIDCFNLCSNNAFFVFEIMFINIKKLIMEAKLILSSLRENVGNTDGMVEWVILFEELYSIAGVIIPYAEISNILEKNGYSLDDYYSPELSTSSDNGERIRYICSRIIRHVRGVYPLGMNEIREVMKPFYPVIGKE